MAGLSGELMADLVGELGEDKAGALDGEAAATVVGERTEEESRAGAGKGHRGLWSLGAGVGVVLSGFAASGINGSEKKRVPGDFMRGICKETEDEDIFTNY